MMRKVAIDLRAWSWAGIGRYSRCLLRELLKREDGWEYIGLVSEKDLPEADRFLNDGIGKKKIILKVIEGSYYSWREQLLLPRQLAMVPADLWHFTHFNVPAMFKGPYVVTIHDVTRLIFPGQTQRSLARQLAYEWIFRRGVSRAKMVLSVSQTTLKDLKEVVGYLPPAVITPEGVEPSYHRTADREIRQKARLMTGSSGPFVLYVGVWMGHKNLRRILEAFAEAKETHINLKLVMTGRKKRGYEDVPRLAREAGLVRDDVLYLGFVPERILPGLYAEAVCLLLPSLYEGFGLPAVEAMACGCPVIAANSSSLPEVTDGKVWLVNPEDPRQIAEAIIKAGQGYSGELIAAGRRQAQKFTWERCAEETAKVYAKILKIV